MVEGADIVRFGVGVLVASSIFACLEGWFPLRREQRRWRRGAVTDWVYLLSTAAIDRIVGPYLAVQLVLSLLFWPRLGASWIAAFPPAVQAIAMLIVGDLIGYWLHRAYHRFPLLWRFHAVHHSSEELDWLASVRIHPVSEILSVVVRISALYLIGFSLDTLAAYAPLLALFALLSHANVPWTFGVLGRVIVSPAYHRLHHEVDPESGGKNFAAFFSIWDRLFGTAQLPGKGDPHLGLGWRMSDHFAGQMLDPFRAPRLSRARSLDGLRKQD